MRPIKFRVWDTLYNEMIYDVQFRRDDRTFDQFLDSRYALMQFTGKRDIHKTDIYRGDILRKGDTTATVEWDEVYLCWKAEAKDGIHRLWPASWHMYEVIGNIYEDEELLSGT